MKNFHSFCEQNSNFSSLYKISQNTKKHSTTDSGYLVMRLTLASGILCYSLQTVLDRELIIAEVKSKVNSHFNRLFDIKIVSNDEKKKV